MRRNPMDIDPAVWEQVFASGATQTEHFIHAMQQEFTEGSELQTLQSSGQEKKRKKTGKEIGMMRRRKVGGMKALRWILMWILLVVEEIQAHQEAESVLMTVLAPAWET